MEKEGGNLQEVRYFGFRESVCNFSLKYREIRPSAVFGTKRKTALRGEGFAWVTDLESFLKTPRGRGFSLLAFYSSFKGYVNV